MTILKRGLTLALIATMTAGQCSVALAVNSPAAAGKVVESVGSVRLNHRPAAVGSIVHQGDTIETGAASHAIVRLADGSAIRITFSSQVMIAEMAPAASFLSLLRGGLLSVVHKGSRFKVRSPQAVAAVMGTVFYIESSQAKPNYACICEGTVELASTSKGGLHRVITTKTHTAFLVEPQQFGKSTLWGHTDADVIGLRKYLH